jgi:hypothetical protein
VLTPAVLCVGDPRRVSDSDKAVGPPFIELIGLQVVVNYHTHGSLLFGMGRWAIDQTQNMGLEDYKYYDVLGHSTYVWQLQRYDMNEV